MPEWLLIALVILAGLAIVAWLIAVLVFAGIMRNFFKSFKGPTNLFPWSH